jgi:AraC-like DNA-binding protein
MCDRHPAILVSSCCMAKVSTLCCFTLILLACLAKAQPGISSRGGIGGIPYANRTPIVDGIGDEWPEKPAPHDCMANPNPKHTNCFTVQLQWDPQYLYMFAEIKDDRLVQLTTDSSRRYLNDAVEVYVDPRDDSGKRMDINDYQFIVDFTGGSAVLKGEKAAIQDTSKTAPKELGISTVAFQSAVKQWEGDPSGYSVEMALPFAGMGALPMEGMRLKLDFCVDDVDSLIDLPSWPDSLELPLYYCASWDGYKDFSFPDQWRRFELTGGPSLGNKIGRMLSTYWIYVVLTLIGAGIVIVWQTRRIRQLKDVLPRARVSAEVREAAMVREAPVTPAPEMKSNESNSRKQTASPPTKKPPHPLIERCRQLILTNLDRELKMEELASECAVSLRQLQRIFKEEMDMSPGNFVVVLKMEQAAALLGTGKFNVSEVAWQLGYTDSSYFSRVFKKYHGVAPREWLAVEKE